MQRQAITTRYIGPTNFRPSRIVATADAGKITVSYNPAIDTDGNHRAAMLAFCHKFGWGGQNYHPGGLPNGSTVWVHVTPEGMA